MTADTLQVTHASLSLSVNDLVRSRHFYVDGLGFTVEQEWKNDAGVVQGLMLKASQASVGLSQDDFAKGRDRAKGVGLSLYLETGQDIAAIAQRARAVGIHLDADPAPLPWGPLGCAVNDPDGFRVIICNAS